MALPYTLANGPGNLPDATQLMANFNALLQAAGGTMTGDLKINIGTSKVSLDATATTFQIGNNYDLGTITDATKTSANMNFDIGTPATVTIGVASTINTSPVAVASFANAGVAIKGTNTNDNAAAGWVGEYIQSVFSNVAFPATTVFGDATSISLTAGDWDVTFNALFAPGGGLTVTSWTVGISTTSGNSSTGLTVGSNYIAGATANATSGINTIGTIAAYRVSLASTTTVYAKFSAIYSAGGPFLYGRLSARRVR